MEAAQNRFTDELLKEIVPFVEKNYRVLTGRENRAIAGLSMGGGQTLRVVTTHPDQFAYVGIWSAGLFGGNAEDWEKRNESFLKARRSVQQDGQAVLDQRRRQGFRLERLEEPGRVLEKHGIKHELHISGGGHTWINWRHYLTSSRRGCSDDSRVGDPLLVLNLR